MKKARENNLIDRITAKEMLMDNLVFEESSFDVIWSEGAIYNIGFEKGLSLWKKYLKDNGFIAVSEISWLTGTRPEEIEKYWVNAYKVGLSNSSVQRENSRLVLLITLAFSARSEITLKSSSD